MTSSFVIDPPDPLRAVHERPVPDGAWRTGARHGQTTEGARQRPTPRGVVRRASRGRARQGWRARGRANGTFSLSGTRAAPPPRWRVRRGHEPPPDALPSRPFGRPLAPTPSASL